MTVAKEKGTSFLSGLGVNFLLQPLTEPLLHHALVVEVALAGEALELFRDDGPTSAERMRACQRWIDSHAAP